MKNKGNIIFGIIGISLMWFGFKSFPDIMTLTEFGFALIGALMIIFSFVTLKFTSERRNEHGK